MPRLFQRDAAVTVGGLRFVELDYRFSVVKTLSREPNTAEIQIFNLSSSSRKQIEETENQQVRLEAGYKNEDGIHVIFEGDLRKASSMRDGSDIITTVEAGDGERALRGKRINKSFGPGTGLFSVIKELGNAIGVGTGNISELARTAGFEGLGDEFSEGVVVSGNPRKELSGLLDSAGIDWSIQDGNLQLLTRGGALAVTAVKLTPNTGLLDSPSVDSEGLVRARSLIIPDILPGRLVEIESEFVRGLFKVDKASYVGDTSIGASDWTIDIEMKAPV